MIHRVPSKIIKVGNSLAIVIPAQICRDLEIRRGDFLEITVGSRYEIILQKIKVVREGELTK